MKMLMRTAALVVAAMAALAPSSEAQDRLKTYPGYESFQQFMREVPKSYLSGAVQARWIDSATIEYTQGGKRYRFDARSLSATEIPVPADQAERKTSSGPERGRQYESAESPDKKLKAFYKDRNLWLGDADGSNAIAITTEGSVANRTKFGSASWVYGEELDQNTAMWWSPDGTKLAYYGFDESMVPDYFLQMEQTKLYSTPDIEAYPKVGYPNPVVDLYIYDLATKKITKLDIRSGQPFDENVLGYYSYHVGWTPDSKELTFNRTNRRQNAMELTACAAATGKCRAIVREEWPTAWVENSPEMKYLEDGKRFVWASERTGFRNLYLYDLSGKLISTLTKHPFEVGAIVSIDEDSNTLFYTARSGDNHMKMQLHRVALNGKNDKRLTDPKLHHSISASPDAKFFVDVAQAHDIAPVTRLIDGDGKVVGEIAKSDITKYTQQPVELFTFKAADGTTTLHGMLHKPANFDPERRYPLLVSVYGGPSTNGARETFTTASPLTAFGFLVVTLDSRSAAGRGKRFLDAIYQKLGTVEIDDQAAGVKSLCARAYVDCSRVGIYGTSYGGYASAMAILRHPDVFHAAAASSPVTDWRHYDTIYTERFMWTPQGNTAGYDAGSAMTYVDRLKGRLMLYYGTADNNVHPNNTMQLIQALQKAGKSFEVQVGPDKGHTSIGMDRMMEFFIENLVLSAKTTT